ncbi:MAG: TetR/AcrR family transcriptional regulator, partial [Actinomycetota bacterium]
DERFRVILHNMRDRHVKRFVAAYRTVFDVDEVSGVSLELATEAMTCMVEQCCYVWFAQEDRRDSPTSVDDAVTATSRAWYSAMFGDVPVTAPR